MSERKTSKSTGKTPARSRVTEAEESPLGAEGLEKSKTPEQTIAELTQKIEEQAQTHQVEITKVKRDAARAAQFGIKLDQLMERLAATEVETTALRAAEEERRNAERRREQEANERSRSTRDAERNPRETTETPGEHQEQRDLLEVTTGELPREDSTFFDDDERRDSGHTPRFARQWTALRNELETDIRNVQKAIRAKDKEDFVAKQKRMDRNHDELRRMYDEGKKAQCTDAQYNALCAEWYCSSDKYIDQVAQNGTFWDRYNREADIKRQEEDLKRKAGIEKPPAVKPFTPEKFTGDCTKWKGWKASFDRAIHERTDLPEIEKFNHLMGSLEGTAKTMLGQLNFSTGVYSKAIKMLEDQYGDKDAIILAHLAKMRAIQTCRSVKDFANLRDTIQIHWSGLIALGCSEVEYRLQVQTKLETSLTREQCDKVRRHIPEGKEKDLQAWFDALTKEIKEDARQTMMRSNEKTAGVNTAGERSGPRGKGQGQATKCVFCGKEDHQAFNCTKVSLEEKKKKLNENKGCFRCLKTGHQSKDCQTKWKCKHCNKSNHNSALCIAKFGTTRPRQQPQAPVNTAAVREPPPAAAIPAAQPAPAVTVTTATAPAVPTIAAALAIPTSPAPTLMSGAIGPTVMPTFTVYVLDRDGKEHRALGMLDSGSSRTFVRRDFVRKLGKRPVSTEILSIQLFGGHDEEAMEFEEFSLRMRGTYHNKTEAVTIRALAKEELSTLTDYEVTDFAQKLAKENVPLADDRIFGTRGFDSIDILVGMDQHWTVVQQRHLPKPGPRGLAAVHTVFGWVIQGAMAAWKDRRFAANMAMVGTVHDTPLEQLEFDLREFWALEHLGILAEEEEDPRFLLDYEEGISRSPTGRYRAPLPYKNCWKRLKDNKPVAKQRLASLMTQFARNPADLAAYHEQFQGYIKDGFIKKADPEYKGRMVYLPHRDIRRPEAASTKVRPVFDGSSHQKGSPSLNQVLEVGPNLNPELLQVLIRFRMYQVAWTADITKAFLQIELDQEDSQVIRFLWYEDPAKPETLTEYAWARLPFGLTSSPFILRAVLSKHLRLYENIYPETVRQLREQLYVDDWLGGADTVESAVKRITETLIILRDAKMELAKWITSTPELARRLQGIVEFHNEPTTIGRVSQVDKSKALGVYWDPETDHFVFQPKKLLEQAGVMGLNPTKRRVFSLALSLFDPMGILAPVVLVSKLIMQRIWEYQLKWDDNVPDEIAQSWSIFLEGLDGMEDVKIARWVGTREDTPVEFHAFCDASEDAYAAALYVRRKGNPAKSTLMCSKSRVAPPPKKSVSIPRLELLSNVLAARLVTYARKALKERTCDATAWTDSMIALYWITGESGKWKTFVHNRVEEVTKAFKPDDIRHCPGLQNPADIASRGATVRHLIKLEPWWEGPEWLQGPPEGWPSRKTLTEMEKNAEVQKEEKKVIAVLNVDARRRGGPINTNTVYAMEYARGKSTFTSLCKGLLWTSRIQRHWTKGRPNKKEEEPMSICGPREGIAVYDPTAKEKMDAKLRAIQISQMTAWPLEYRRLRKEKALPKRSEISLMNPKWDARNQVMRGAGRADRAYVGEQLPILLPSHCHITKLIIEDCHQKMMHSGRATVLAELRKEYYIYKMELMVKKYLGRCVICARNNARSFEAPAAPLREDRLKASRPFEVVGVDMAGPFKVYLSRHTSVTNPPTVANANILLFTCAATRAVHLEGVPNGTALSALYALRRFVAMRGMPLKMVSDRAGNFESNAEILRKISGQKWIGEFLTNNNIEWEFLPSCASWWGGFWERLVQLMKKRLYGAFKTKILDYEQFCTVAYEMADVMNSRPLVKCDLASGQVLTPSMLLFGHHTHVREIERPTGKIDAEHYSNLWDKKRLLAKDAERRGLMNEWWEKFHKEYLKQIERFHYKKTKRLKVPEMGQVVIVHQEHKPRSAWVVARIVELIPGRDGHIREVVMINSNQERISRAVQHVYPLEAEAGQIDEDHNNPGQFVRLRERVRVTVPPQFQRRSRAVRKDGSHEVDPEIDESGPPRNDESGETSAEE